MSMRYFTLSAVCMLIFCMLLALSGTTDFPGGHPGMASQPGHVSAPPVSSQPGSEPAMASVCLLSERVEASAGAELDGAAEAAAGRQSRLLILGAGFILGWILLSFKLLSRSRR